MKKILLPTDFSENSRNAIFYALSLYGNHSCKFILLHTFFIPYSNPDIAVSVGDVTAQNADEDFNKLRAQIKKEFPSKDFNIETEFRVGDLVQTISHIVIREKINLIIMGTQGADGFLEKLIGSSTSAVIKEVSCPVLTIPENSKYQPPTKIVLALDPGYKDIAPSALEPMLEIAKEHHSEIMILYVIEDEEHTHINRDKLERLFTGFNYSFHAFYYEKPADGINKFVKATDVSLLTLIKHEHSLYEKLFHKSVTKKIALHSKIPLMILNLETTLPQSPFE